MEGFRLLFVFALIMILLWRRAPLGPVMLGSAALLALLYQTGLTEFLEIIWKATSNWTTLELTAILLLIMIFERILDEQGYLKEVLCGLRGLIRDRRAVMAFLPAFIGLMPSAGGALFSAPLVGQAADGIKITAEEKSFVNYYYRHIWEYFLPLYPGVLLASRLSGLPLPHLIAALAPYGLLIILLGLPVLLRLPGAAEKNQPDGNISGPAKKFFTGVLPMLVVVFLVLAVKVEVTVAVGTMIVILLVYHRYTPFKFWLLCKRALGLKTFLLVWEIMVFKQVLVDTGAVEGLSPLLARLPVPEFIVFCLLSFLVGLLTGLTVAYVGIVFPLVIAASGGQIDLPLAALIFVTGFAGNMLTPMHLCMALTVDFFKADLQKVLRMIAGPEATLLVIAVVVYLCLAANGN